MTGRVPCPQACSPGKPGAHSSLACWGWEPGRHCVWWHENQLCCQADRVPANHAASPLSSGTSPSPSPSEPWSSHLRCECEEHGIQQERTRGKVGSQCLPPAPFSIPCHSTQVCGRLVDVGTVQCLPSEGPGEQGPWASEWWHPGQRLDFASTLLAEALSLCLHVPQARA